MQVLRLYTITHSVQYKNAKVSAKLSKYTTFYLWKSRKFKREYYNLGQFHSSLV